MSEMDLYYFPTSPPVRSVLLLARFIGVTFNLKLVNIFKGEQLMEEFMKINPLHTIPTLDDNGFILYESRTIMRYLVDKYNSDGNLVPKDIKEQALMDQRLYFDATVLFPKLVQYFLPVLFDNKDIDSEAYVPVDEAFKILDKLQEGKKWIIGDTMTIADFAFLTTVSTAEAVLFDISQYPNVNRWYIDIKALLENFGLDELNTKPCEMVQSKWMASVKLSPEIKQ